MKTWKRRKFPRRRLRLQHLSSNICIKLFCFLLDYQEIDSRRRRDLDFSSSSSSARRTDHQNNGDHAWMKTIKTCWLKVDNLLLLYLFWHTDCRLKQQTSMIRTHFIGIVWHWQAIIRGPFQRTLLLPVIFWTTSKSKPSLLLRKWQRQVPIFLSIICQWSRNDLFSKMVK